MSELDASARRHAAVVRDAYRDVEAPDLQLPAGGHQQPPPGQRSTTAVVVGLVVAAVVLVAVGLSLRPVPGPLTPATQATTDPSAAASPTEATTDPSAAASPTETTANPSAAASPIEEVALAFTAFAQDPSAATLNTEPLHLADVVRLGLAEEPLTEISREEAADPSSWEIIPDGLWRGRVGPFSALRPLAEAQAVEVHRGDSPRCASPPGNRPEGTDGLDRIAIRPVEASLDSCLRWFSVDLYLDDGVITTVTLDLWEP